MRLPSRWFAESEVAKQPYGTEVLCSNWVERPVEQPVAPTRASATERLREAEAPTFLARIYASQRC